MTKQLQRMIDRGRSRSIALIEYPLLAVKVGDGLRKRGIPFLFETRLDKNVLTMVRGLSKEEACHPGVACFIGDSDVDLKTGVDSGLDFIGVDWGFRGRAFLLEHGASVVVDNTEELEKLILMN